MWRVTLGRLALAPRDALAVADAAASMRAARPAAAATACICARSLHSSSAPFVISGGAARRRSGGSSGGADSGRSSARAAAAEQASREAARLDALRARAAHESALDQAAHDAAFEGGVYRRPHLKRRGKAFEKRQQELAEADMLDAAAADGQLNEAELDERALADLEASLTPAERRRLEEMEREDNERAGRASASSASSKEQPEPEPSRVISNAEAYEARETGSDAMPASQVAHVEAQLRRLDASTPSSRRMAGGGGGLGFDTIDLSRSSIVEDEVFETVHMSAAMRKLATQARQGDSQKRMAFQRVERVTERTKEIIGRVLLEESVRIAAQQAAAAAKQGSARSSRPPAAATPASSGGKGAADKPNVELVDLRTTPTFRIHQVRYSTDLAWASIMWTLGREGYDATDDPDMEVVDPRPKSKSKKPVATSPSGAPLPNWFAMKSRVTATLNHVLKGLRFTLGRELDIRYTPNIKFTYDHLHDAQQTKDRLERERETREREELQQALQLEADEHAEIESGDPMRAAAARKAQLLRSGGGEFDAEAFNAPEELQADLDMDERFDENRTYFLPKRKIAALVAREKLKIKEKEARDKKRKLLAEARQMSLGVSTKEVPPPPPETTDPTVLRAYLKSTMARLVRSKKASSPANLAEIAATRAQLTQLQQVQALAKKSRINPVEKLREARARDEMPHYPHDWRKKKEQFWKKTDGRTRNKE